METYFDFNPPSNVAEMNETQMAVVRSHGNGQLRGRMRGGWGGWVGRAGRTVPGRVIMQALEIEETGCCWSVYLIIDGPRKDLIGTVCHLEEDTSYVDVEAPSPLKWIEWLRRRMSSLERAYAETGEGMFLYVHPD